MPLQFTHDDTKRALASIKQFSAEHLDDEIGDLKAQLVLEFFLKELAPTVYNQAIGDAQKYLQERVMDLEGVCHQPEFGYWAGGKAR
jgi:uncharacterized protein (DUF2164 family)